MCLKENIFGSNAEEKNFKYLKSKWGEFFAIYPQFSYAQLFDVDKLKLKPDEKDTLLKMSVDYIICDKVNGKPLMCIEFDGLTKGYNKGDNFKGDKFIREDINSTRKWKFDLKLKIAKENKLPFYIVSYEEFAPLADVTLSIIDGIIGHTLASKDLYKLFNEYANKEKRSLSELEVENLLSEVELDLEKKYNPLSRAVDKFYELWGHGFITEKTMRSYSPEDENYVGLEASCVCSKGEIIQKACMRDIESQEFHPYAILEDICIILLIQKLKPFKELKQITYKILGY